MADRSDDAAQFVRFPPQNVSAAPEPWIPGVLIAATWAPALPKSETGHRRSPLPNKDPQYPQRSCPNYWAKPVTLWFGVYFFSRNSTTRGSPGPLAAGRYVMETGVPGLRAPQAMLSETAAV